MSNEMAWLLHGVFLGMMLATMVRLVADAIAAQRVAVAAHAAANRALKTARGEAFLASLRAHRRAPRTEAR
ncbi:hypothetical protein ACIG8S_23645 [[Kitasatospora] papulosa]|uniref:hypothetical protein n=1 Tax=[Kitasatospora] papulosa TaxID=1464011 RepID=UPI0037D0D63A